MRLPSASVLIASTLVAGCSGEGPRVAACDHVAKLLVRSPATYRRLNSPKEGDDILIEFEAANAFGLPVRDWAVCRFDPARPDDAVMTDFAVINNPLTRAQREMAVQLGRWKLLNDRKEQSE